MAGNIIPAIATTNAIVAGVAVMQAFKILQDKIKQCTTVYVRLTENPQKQILVPEKYLNDPNPKCYVCSPKPEVTLLLNVNKMTVKELEESVLKKSLNMIAPDVICQAKQLVLISSEEGETEVNNDKKLAELGIIDGSMLQVDDFLQNYELSITINHYESLKDEPEFQVISDPSVIKSKESVAASTSNGEEPSTSTGATTSSNNNEADDDDICIVEEPEPEPSQSPNTRKRATINDLNNSKRRKSDVHQDQDDDSDDDIVMLDD